MNHEEISKRVAALNLPASVLTKNQKKTVRRDYMQGGKPHAIVAEIRHDDECGNGHNTFAITATLYGPDRIPGETTTKHEPSGKTLWCYGGGCCHEEIAKHFPELAPLIRFHLMSTDGPMHYIANAVFLASDRDCWGKLKGEPRQWSRVVRFEGFPFTFSFRRSGEKFAQWLETSHSATELELVEVIHQREPKTFGSNWTFSGFPCTWHECPFDSHQEASQWREALQTLRVIVEKVPTAWGEGKARELDSARSAAIWPDATDDQLTAPGLEDRLLARLPALISEFKTAVESLGFTY